MVREGKTICQYIIQYVSASSMLHVCGGVKQVFYDEGLGIMKK